MSNEHRKNRNAPSNPSGNCDPTTIYHERCCDPGGFSTAVTAVGMTVEAGQNCSSRQQLCMWRGSTYHVRAACYGLRHARAKPERRELCRFAHNLVKLTCDHAMLAIETDLDHTQCSTSVWRLTYDLLVESARQSSVRVNVAMWVVGATEARHVERLEELRSCVRSRAAGRSNDGELHQQRGSRERSDAGHSHPNCMSCTSAQYTPVAAHQEMSRIFSHLCSTICGIRENGVSPARTLTNRAPPRSQSCHRLAE